MFGRCLIDPAGGGQGSSFPKTPAAGAALSSLRGPLRCDPAIKNRERAVTRKRKSRARQKPSKPTYNGDHGTGTAAATHGTVIEPAEDENGKNPNNIGVRRRKSAIESMSLTMRQEQTAKAIQKAWGNVDKLGSGGPLREHVDASPKPDAAIAAQVEANNRWTHVMRPFSQQERIIIEWVCCANYPITTIGRRLGIPRASELFKKYMDKGADWLRY